jgi:hypothetical protein
MNLHRSTSDMRHKDLLHIIITTDTYCPQWLITLLIELAEMLLTACGNKG